MIISVNHAHIDMYVFFYINGLTEKHEVHVYTTDQQYALRWFSCLEDN
jgi:hypothetical protein